MSKVSQKDIFDISFFTYMRIDMSSSSLRRHEHYDISCSFHLLVGLSYLLYTTLPRRGQMPDDFLFLSAWAFPVMP